MFKKFINVLKQLFNKVLNKVDDPIEKMNIAIIELKNRYNNLFDSLANVVSTQEVMTKQLNKRKNENKNLQKTIETMVQNGEKDDEVLPLISKMKKGEVKVKSLQESVNKLSQTEKTIRTTCKDISEQIEEYEDNLDLYKTQIESNGVIKDIYRSLGLKTDENIKEVQKSLEKISTQQSALSEAYMSITTENKKTDNLVKDVECMDYLNSLKEKCNKA